MHYVTIHMYNNMNAGDKVTDFENTFATYKEMTRTHPNQSLNALISLLILCSTWQFRPFPKFRHFRKPQNTNTKNVSSKSALLILTVSTSAFDSTNLFLLSRHHIPTASVAPLPVYKPTHKPQLLQVFVCCGRQKLKKIQDYNKKMKIDENSGDWRRVKVKNGTKFFKTDQPSE